MNYSIYINVHWTVDPTSIPFLSGYKEGQRLVKTWEGVQGSRGDPSVALEFLFEKHNRDDRPDGQVGPSLSVGDVVILGDKAHAVTYAGFEEVPMPTNIETEKTWVQLTEERR